MAASKLIPLKRSSDFQALKESGRKVSVSRWLTAVYGPNNEQGLRIGFTITKKVGTAVRRNRLRRWGREALKKALTSKPSSASAQVDINFLLRPMPEGFYEKMEFATYESVFKKTVESVFQRS